MTRKRRRIAIFAVAAVLLGLLGGLLLAEVGLRAALAWKFRGSLERLPTFTHSDPDAELWLGAVIRPVDDPEIVYRLEPGTRGRFEGAPLRVNSDGFRGEEVVRPKPAGTWRLAALGDSNTFGWGVREEEAYPAVLARALASLLADEPLATSDDATTATEPALAARVEVLNLGTPGYNAVQEAAVFERHALALEPDAVVVLVDVNDALLPVFLAEKDYLRLDRLEILELGRVLRPGFFSGESLLTIRSEFAYRPPEGGMMVMDESVVPEHRRGLYGWGPFERAHRRIAELCAERSIPGRVVFPAHAIFEEATDREVDRDPDYDRPRALFAELGVPVTDAFPELRRLGLAGGFGTADLCVDHPRDIHPNAFRHALIARELLEPLAATLREWLRARGEEPDEATWLARLGRARAAIEAEAGDRFEERPKKTPAARNPFP